MTENEVAAVIVDAAYKVHVALGPGLLESVYATVLEYELKKRGLQVQPEAPMPIHYENIVINAGFKADLLVEGIVIVELKSVEALAAIHKKQTLTYLRLSKTRLGLLINFNVELIKNGIKRIVNGLPE